MSEEAKQPSKTPTPQLKAKGGKKPVKLAALAGIIALIAYLIANFGVGGFGGKEAGDGDGEGEVKKSSVASDSEDNKSVSGPSTSAEGDKRIKSKIQIRFYETTLQVRLIPAGEEIQRIKCENFEQALAKLPEVFNTYRSDLVEVQVDPLYSTHTHDEIREQVEAALKAIPNAKEAKVNIGKIE